MDAIITILKVCLHRVLLSPNPHPMTVEVHNGRNRGGAKMVEE